MFIADLDVSDTQSLKTRIDISNVLDLYQVSWAQNEWINELQSVVKKPVYASDGKEMGIVSSLQSK